MRGELMRPEFELKEQLRLSSISVMEVCERLKRPYGTVANWLNGFVPLLDEARRIIRGMIAEIKETASV
jgi:hypothetical protein